MPRSERGVLSSEQMSRENKKTDKLKIAHVVCTFPPYRGGMGNSAYHFARLVAEQGHEVTVFTPDYRNKERAAGAPAGQKFKVERLMPLFAYGNAAVLPQLLWRLSGFDVVHLHYPFYGAMLPILLKKYFSGGRLKLVIHYHMDSVAAGFKGAIFRANRAVILPRLADAADFITCASLDYLKNSALAGYYARRREKFITLPFGVDLSQFKIGGEDTARDGKKILFVGGLDKAHYFKGVEVLLRAFAGLKADRAIKERIAKLDLIIVGDGELKNYYQKLAGRLGLEEAVIFAGSLASHELARYYRSADVFVLPSINQGEAFGLVLLEAMASGLPVVATNLPGVRSVFKNGREGLIAAPGSARDLKAKLKTILFDEALAKKMGVAARKLAEEKYDWRTIGADLIRLYYRVNFTPK